VNEIVRHAVRAKRMVGLPLGARGVDHDR
jgi:hypothetical protein